MMNNLLLPLTDTAISDCRRHIEQYSDTDPAIIAYLTRHINGLMCAEIEQVVTRLIRKRLRAGCGDDATLNFINSMRRSAIRNATYGEIRKTIKLLGENYDDRFRELVTNAVGEEGIGKLGTAVGKRNEDSHETPPDVTFNELEEAYGVATSVVYAVSRTLTCRST